MNIKSAQYEPLLASVLEQNALILFDFGGAEVPLDYARHIDAMLGPSGAVTREIHLQLLIDLWASWELHLKRSAYSLPHLGAVHVEASWIVSGHGGPPCVLLMNSLFGTEGEVEVPSPLAIQWKAEAVLGALQWTTLDVPEVGTCYRAYRRSCQRRPCGPIGRRSI